MTPETPLEPESFVPLLERIRDLLLKHDFLAQATVVAGLIDLAHLEDPSFADRLGGGELWGSAGSVADIVDLRRSLEPVDPETERDSVQLIHELIQLADDSRRSRTRAWRGTPRTRRATPCIVRMRTRSDRSTRSLGQRRREGLFRPTSSASGSVTRWPRFAAPSSARGRSPKPSATCTGTRSEPG